MRCPYLDTALIDGSPGETRVALLAGGIAWELYLIRHSEAAPGDIFLGRIRARAAGGGAAFVDLGSGPDGFLGVEDCPQGLPPEGSLLLVEVLLAARAEKGPKVTAMVSLATELMAYSPLRPGLSLSSKITHKAERTRLTAWGEAAVQPGEGLVLRTKAWECPEDTLSQTLNQLRQQWADLCQQRARAHKPQRLSRGALPLASALAGRSVERVLCAGADTAEEARRARPDLAEVIRSVRAPHALWAEEGMDEALDAALSVRCGLLTIETTAALTAIDVDSGPYTPEEANQRALLEIARQIRLRNLAGMIVVDFAAPRRGAEGHKKAMAHALAQALADDPARPQVVGVSGLGLVEIRRPRRGAPLADLMLAPRPTAGLLPQAAALESLRQCLAAVACDPGFRPLLKGSGAIIDGLRGPWRAALAETESRLGASLPLQVVANVAPAWFDLTSQPANHERKR